MIPRESKERGELLQKRKQEIEQLRSDKMKLEQDAEPSLRPVTSDSAKSAIGMNTKIRQSFFDDAIIMVRNTCSCPHEGSSEWKGCTEGRAS